MTHTSEKREKAEKIIHDLHSSLANTELTYVVAMGEGDTFSTAARMNSPREMTNVIAAVILKAGLILLSNEGMEIDNMAEILGDAVGISFKMLEEKAPKTNLILGPWGKKGAGL